MCFSFFWLRERINKIIQWALAEKLVRPVCVYLTGFPIRRKCEYDPDTLEYWVNTRTTGTLSREDVEQLTRTHTHAEDVEGEGLTQGRSLSLVSAAGGFNNLGMSDMPVEGDQNMSVPRL